MKVSRFEPHILAPLQDANDLDVFMKDLAEESEHISASKASSGEFAEEQTAEELKRSMARLITSIQSQREKIAAIGGLSRSKKRSKKGLALSRYHDQNASHLDKLTQYSKII